MSIILSKIQYGTRSIVRFEDLEQTLRLHLVSGPVDKKFFFSIRNSLSHTVCIRNPYHTKRVETIFYSTSLVLIRKRSVLNYSCSKVQYLVLYIRDYHFSIQKQVIVPWCLAIQIEMNIYIQKYTYKLSSSIPSEVLSIHISKCYSKPCYPYVLY